MQKTISKKQFLKRLKDRQHIRLVGEYLGFAEKTTFKCKYHGILKPVSPARLLERE